MEKIIDLCRTTENMAISVWREGVDIILERISQ